MGPFCEIICDNQNILYYHFLSGNSPSISMAKRSILLRTGTWCINLALYCLHSAQTTNPTKHHELINVRIRKDSWNFANFLSKSWQSKILLRYTYDRVTDIRGIRLESLKYCQEFTTIYKNRLWILHERYESVTNQLRICRMHLRIRYD